MAEIRFAEWTPDLAPLGSPGIVNARNVLPSIDGYIPFHDHSSFTSTLSSTATQSWVLGAISVKSNSLNSYTYAGNGSDLFVLSSNNWINYTRTATSSSSSTNIAVQYDTGAENYWEFAKFNDIVIATNFDNYPQYITAGESTVFKNLIDSLRFKTVDTIKGFVVAGDIYDVSAGVRRTNRIQWCGYEAPIGSDNWVPSIVNQSDYQDLNSSGGAVKKIVGGEYGLVVCEQSVFRLTYIGAPLVFQVDETLPGIGTEFPRSVCKYGDTVFMLSRAGFIAISGGAALEYIGSNKVDNTIIKNIDTEYFYNVIGSVDVSTGRVYWIYPSNSATSGMPDTVVVFDTKSGRWSYAKQNLWLIFSGISSAVSLDEMTAGSSYSNLDTLGVSLDSTFWKGNSRYIGGFNEAHELGDFTGSALPAIIETGEIKPFGDSRALITSVRPLVDGATNVAVAIGYRDRQQDAYVEGPIINVDAFGNCQQRINARYVRVILKTTGSFDKIIGVDPMATKAGKR
jgi:hypothetical protein